MIRTRKYGALLVALVIGFLLGVLSYRFVQPLWADFRKQVGLNLEYPQPHVRLKCASVASSPIPRVEALTAVIGDKLYVFGGFERGLRAIVRSDRYDPVTDSWTRIADLPAPVTHAGVTVDGTSVWIAGGFVGDSPGKATDAVWRYDSVADRWEAAPPLPEPRASAPLVRQGRFLHFIGGLRSDRQTDAGDHWRLNLDSQVRWEPRAKLPDPRNHGSGIELNGTIYMIGGQHDHDGAYEDVASVHAYDPMHDSWRELARLPFGRSHFEPGTFIADGKIVIVGGRANKQIVLYDITAYDPIADTWTDLRPMSVPARAPTAARIGDRVLIGLGGLLPTGLDPRAEFNSCTLDEIGLSAGQ